MLSASGSVALDGSRIMASSPRPAITLSRVEGSVYFLPAPTFSYGETKVMGGECRLWLPPMPHCSALKSYSTAAVENLSCGSIEFPREISAKVVTVQISQSSRGPFQLVSKKLFKNSAHGFFRHWRLQCIC